MPSGSVVRIIRKPRKISIHKIVIGNPTRFNGGYVENDFLDLQIILSRGDGGEEEECEKKEKPASGEKASGIIDRAPDQLRRDR